MRETPQGRYSFSLRVLIVTVLVAALALLLAAWKYREWQREHQFDELIRLIETTIDTSHGDWTDTSSQTPDKEPDPD